MRKKLKVTPVFWRMTQARATGRFHVYVFEGGSRSSKTYSLIQFFLEWAKRSRETKRVVISRKKATWLYATVWHDFEKIYTEMGLLGQVGVNKSLHTLKLNNFMFEFVGLDVQRLHGLTCDVFWINEAMEASKDDFDQLEQRCAEFAILDYNPTAEEHWIYDNVCSREDCYFDHSTMLDNPFVPENMKRKILSYEPTERNYENGTVDIRKWKIYGLGERAKIEGLIFDNVKIVPEIPFWVKQRWRCVDFGFTNDPTAIATVGFHNNTLFIDEECYRTQMLNPDIIKEIKRHPSLKCWCENAEPKTIRELQLAGIPALATRKGSTRPDYEMIAEYLPDIDAVQAGLDDYDLSQIMSFLPQEPIIVEAIDDFIQMEPSYEEKKTAVKKAKKEAMERAAENWQNIQAYVTISFADVEEKRLFCEIAGLMENERFISGKDILEMIQ